VTLSFQHIPYLVQQRGPRPIILSQSEIVIKFGSYFNKTERD
jgi:hypothetical protein